MPNARQLIDAIPQAIRLLIDRAGHGSLRATAEAIEKETGERLSAATLSEWSRGAGAPVVDKLVIFLAGLGSDLRGFQKVLDEVGGASAGPEQIRAQLGRELLLRNRMRALLENTPGTPDEPSELIAELLKYLDDLDRIRDAGAA